MKRISLLFVLFFVISNLFSQITDDPERSFDVQKNLFITPLDHTTWDVPTGPDEHRDLLGYNIYIDGVLIGFFVEFFIEEFYYFLTPGQTYIFGVEAVYTGGSGFILSLYLSTILLSIQLRIFTQQIMVMLAGSHLKLQMTIVSCLVIMFI